MEHTHIKDITEKHILFLKYTFISNHRNREVFAVLLK